MLQGVAPLSAPALDAALRAYPFHSSVFVLPPWKDIYTADAERDHSFPWVEHVHRQLVQWYRSCGYVLHEVPRLPVTARAEFVLRAPVRSCSRILERSSQIADFFATYVLNPLCVAPFG